MDSAFYIAKVSKVIDDKLFTIEFTVSGFIENQPAYPIRSMDEPVVGDEILVYNLDPLFSTTFLYRKLKSDDRVGVKYKDKEILFEDDKVTISTPQASIEMKDSGDIEVKGINVNVTGGFLTVNGAAAPTGNGPFCALPACLFTGAPHIGNKVSGT